MKSYKVSGGGKTVATMASSAEEAAHNARANGLSWPLEVWELGKSGALSLTGHGDQAGRIVLRISATGRFRKLVNATQ